jgi:hypothetical protein
MGMENWRGGSGSFCKQVNKQILPLFRDDVKVFRHFDPPWFDGGWSQKAILGDYADN